VRGVGTFGVRMMGEGKDVLFFVPHKMTRGRVRFSQKKWGKQGPGQPMLSTDGSGGGVVNES